MLTCNEVKKLILDAFLEKKEISKELREHAKNCPECSCLLEDLSLLKVELDTEEVEIATTTPSLWYFDTLIESKQKEKDVTLKETVLFFTLGCLVVFIIYLGVKFDLFIELLGFSSLLTFLLTVYAVFTGKEERG